MTSVGMKLVRSTSVVLLIVMIIGVVWSFYSYRKQAQLELLEQSRVLTAQMLALRQVAAENQHKINYDSRGNFEFKHLNPAALLQEVSRTFNKTSEYKIRQVSLRPRLSENRPDQFERSKLEEFSAKGVMPEAWGIDTIQDEQYFRYMVPIEINASCLQCHGRKGEVDVAGYHKEGYEIGDIAGALSISIPMKVKEASISKMITNSILLMLAAMIFSGVVIIYHTNLFVSVPIAALDRFSKQLGEGNLSAKPPEVKAFGEVKELMYQFSSMAKELQDIYEHLEIKVEKRTEELARVNQELEKVNQYKSDFLANMSHELRTPLTAILAFSQQLMEEGEGRLSLGQKEYLQDIQESGQQLLCLINDLLDLAKIESGNMSLQLTEVAVDDIAREVEKLLRPLAFSKNIEISSTFESCGVIIADEVKIRQVLQNLLGNAIKFSAQNGHVDLCVKATQQPSAGINIRVKDTGAGIPLHEQDKIFKAFYQTQRGLVKEHKGTGLGLALVKKIVDLHLGNIELTSEEGLGTCFTVFLPAYPPFDDALE